MRMNILQICQCLLETARSYNFTKLLELVQFQYLKL